METDTTSADQQPGGAAVWTHIAMTMVSLVMLAGFALWQLGKVGDEPGTTDVSGPVISDGNAGATEWGGPAETYQTPAHQPRAAAPIIYLVESEERAKLLIAFVEEANGYRQFEGLPPITAQVKWFDSAEAEEQFWRSLDWVLGAPEMFFLSVVDLREYSNGRCSAGDC